MATGIIPIKKGGTELNFRIVGDTTQPTSAKENDIWVNTAEEISSYVFSYDEPSDPVAGMVWISTDKTSPVAFSVTEDNPVMVYPAACKQYVNNAWVNKDAQTYRNGAWTMWYFYFFKSGTGQVVPWTSYTQSASVTVNIGTEAMSMRADSGYRARSLYTTSMVDVTNFNHIYFDIDCTRSGGSTYNVTRCMTTTASPASTSQPSGEYAAPSSSDRQIVTLDVSNITGNRYICIWHPDSNGYETVYNVYAD